MTRRTHSYILIATVIVFPIAGMAVFWAPRAANPTPSLEAIRALARAKQFNRARIQLRRYLDDNPKNSRARLFMAELATEPSSPNPTLALEHLPAIRPDSPRQAALVKFFEGKAYHQQGRFDLAESSWREAVRLDPLVPEAGWVLIDLLDRESRTEEAHRLGMRLHEIEPDLRDRVRILLEMSRLDIEVPDPLSQVLLFEPLIKEHPEILPISLTLGLALIRVNRSGDGLQILERTVRRYPHSAEAWDAWLTGLYQASEADWLVKEFAALPRSIAADPRFAKHEGMIAQIARDWTRAVDAYRRAFAFEPFNWGVCYRLRFALRQAGDIGEAERITQLYEDYKQASAQMRGSVHERFEPNETASFPADDFNRARGAYYETLSVKTLGVTPHPELYQRLADLREKMGRFDEARAWHRLVIHDAPENPISLAALERLK